MHTLFTYQLTAIQFSLAALHIYQGRKKRVASRSIHAIFTGAPAGRQKVCVQVLVNLATDTSVSELSKGDADSLGFESVLLLLNSERGIVGSVT